MSGTLFEHAAIEPAGAVPGEPQAPVEAVREGKTSLKGAETSDWLRK